MSNLDEIFQRHLGKSKANELEDRKVQRIQQLNEVSSTQSKAITESGYTLLAETLRKEKALMYDYQVLAKTTKSEKLRKTINDAIENKRMVLFEIDKILNERKV